MYNIADKFIHPFMRREVSQSHSHWVSTKMQMSLPCDISSHDNSDDLSGSDKWLQLFTTWPRGSTSAANSSCRIVDQSFSKFVDSDRFEIGSEPSVILKHNQNSFVKRK